MYSYLLRLSFASLVSFAFIQRVVGLTNVTIDETSALISYVPASSWSLHNGPTDILDAGGGHMVTSDPNAYATITYTFVSVHILSTKWPYRVATSVTLDSGTPMTIDLQDHSAPDTGGGPSTMPYSIVRSIIGRESGSHTIRFSVPSGDPYAVLDRLIFEVEDTASSSSVASTSIAKPTSASQSQNSGSSITTTSGSPDSTNVSNTSTSTSSNSGSHTLAIALGVAIPLILLAILLLWCIIRRRNNRRASPVNDEIGYGRGHDDGADLEKPMSSPTHPPYEYNPYAYLDPTPYAPVQPTPVAVAHVQQEIARSHTTSGYASPVPPISAPIVTDRVAQLRDSSKYGDGSDSAGSRYSAASDANIMSIASMSSSEMSRIMAGGASASQSPDGRDHTLGGWPAPPRTTAA